MSRPMESVPPGSCMCKPQDQRAAGLQIKIARTAALVCEAARHAALDGIASALSVATERMPDTPDRIRDIANQVLSRAAIMQAEIGRFIAGARNRDHER